MEQYFISEQVHRVTRSGTFYGDKSECKNLNVPRYTYIWYLVYFKRSHFERIGILILYIIKNRVELFKLKVAQSPSRAESCCYSSHYRACLLCGKAILNIPVEIVSQFRYMNTSHLGVLVRFGLLRLLFSGYEL